MPINLTCQCGKQLRLADSAAGKKGKCPACGAVFDIPASGDAGPAAPPEETPAPAPRPSQRTAAGAPRPSARAVARPVTPRPPTPAPVRPSARLAPAPSERPPSSRVIVGEPCPGCSSPLPKGAVFCVRCGYDTRSGRKTASVRTTAKPVPKGSEQAEIGGPADLTPYTDEDFRSRRSIYAGIIVAGCVIGAVVAASIVGFVSLGKIYAGFTAQYREAIPVGLTFEYLKLAACVIGGAAGGAMVVKTFGGLLPK